MSRAKLKLRPFKERRTARRRKKGVKLSLAAGAAVASPPRRKAASRKGKARASGYSSAWVWPAIGILAFVEVLLLGGHAVRWAMTSPRFVMGEVKVVGHKTLDPESLVKLAGLRPGTNLFEVDLDLVRRRIESNPWVRRSSVRKSPPSTLRIEIEERVPVALVDRKAAIAVDREGVILGPLPYEPEDCPPLLEGFAKKDSRPGERIEGSDFGPALTAASLFAGAPLIQRGCLSVSRAEKGFLRLRALEGNVDLLVNEEKMEAQAARFHAVAKQIFDEKDPSAAPVQLDLTFPGRIIIRPTNTDGGLRG
ncbi:cell division protein FtsQ/DivIB [Nitrospinota bacterium]